MVRLGSKIKGNYDGVDFTGLVTQIGGRFFCVKLDEAILYRGQTKTDLGFFAEDIPRWQIEVTEQLEGQAVEIDAGRYYFERSA